MPVKHFPNIGKPILSEIQECSRTRILDAPNMFGCCSRTWLKKLTAGLSFVHPRQTRSSQTTVQKRSAMHFGLCTKSAFGPQQKLENP